MAWPTSLLADWRTAVGAWNSARGGWRAAWRDAIEFARRREIVVETRVAAQVVLRTRIRLTGDAQTDVARGWITSAAAAGEFRQTTDLHFRAAAAAVRGWAILTSLIRLISHALVATGSLIALVSTWRNLTALEWHALLSIALSQGWVWTGMITASLGFAVRKGVVFWLRQHFRRGLAGIG